jgi:hypothetical protein
MSSYTSSPPVSRPNSRARSETPDILEPPEYSSLSGGGGGFNLADELAMAEESETEEAGFLAPPPNMASVAISGYEGSEYGDIDDDSDGYLSDRVDVDEQQLSELVDEFTEESSRHGAVGQFISDLRNMRGQMDVENHARRYVQK